MAKNITRRQAAKTIAIGTGAALIAPAALADPNPDARLIALEADWLKTIDFIDNREDAPENEIVAACTTLNQIMDTIAETPANGSVGIGVKLRIFHWHITDHEYYDHCISGDLLHSIRRDLGETFYQYPSLNRA